MGRNTWTQSSKPNGLKSWGKPRTPHVWSSKTLTMPQTRLLSSTAAHLGLRHLNVMYGSRKRKRSRQRVCIEYAFERGEKRTSMKHSEGRRPIEHMRHCR